MSRSEEEAEDAAEGVDVRSGAERLPVLLLSVQRALLRRHVPVRPCGTRGAEQSQISNPDE